MKEPVIIMESFDRERDHSSYRFTGLVEVIAAHSGEEVLPALYRVEEAVYAGRHAAGFISYEAAAGLNPELTTLQGGELPLLWFGVFERRLTINPSVSTETEGSSLCAPGGWRNAVSRGEYVQRVERVREYIASGDTYQVNLTMPRRFTFSGDAHALYRELCRSQRAPFCSYLEVDRFRILSASPELFFRLSDGRVTVRPMKGTAARGRWYEEDEEAKQRLKGDPKERAENLMIVDMLRNDLGMVSETGSVEVCSLFDIETLETVHQMTSTVSSRLKEGTGIVDLFRALFPCGSVTGAPKRRTMEIIAELEDSPRGVYTGCIGFISPGPSAVFSVAIRTMVIDTETGKGEMGIGSGVTFDSNADDEFAECMTKGRFAVERRPEFQLIETMLFEEGAGFYLLERHMARLRRSAAYFGFRLDPEPVRRALDLRSKSLKGSNKVRLLLSRKGSFTIQTEPIDEASEERPLLAAFAKERVDSSDPFFYNKTTHRPLYSTAQPESSGCADILFLNERNEVAEGANNNIVAKLDGEWVTPSLESGLLPGVFREDLLERGEIRERVITAEELKSAEEVYLINSVRKSRRVRLV